MENEINVNELVETGKTLIYPQKEQVWAEYCKNDAVTIKNALDIMQLIDKDDFKNAIKSWKKMLKTTDKQLNPVLPVYDILNVVLNFSKKGPDFYEKTVALLGPKDIANNLPTELKEYLNNLRDENAMFEKELHKKSTKDVKPKEFGEE